MSPTRSTPYPFAAAAALILLPPLTGCTEGETHTGDALVAVQELSSPAGPGSGEPNLTVGDDGRVYLSWIEPAADSAHALRFATWDGERWSPPRTIAEGQDWFVNWADFPALAVLPKGRLGAHWLQRNGGGVYSYEVRVAHSPDGGQSWTPGVVAHRDSTEGEHGFVSLWAQGDSTALVWLDGRGHEAAGHAGGAMRLFATTLTADGGRGAEHLLDERVCDCCQTAAASTSNGPLVVYRDRSEDEIRDIYAVRRVEGKWTTPRPVHADGWRIEACPVNGPAISAAGERAVVAWFTAAADTPRVRLAFSGDAGATFGDPLRIDDGDPAGRVDVELLEDGGALVSWLERTSEDAAEVRVRRVSADRSVGPSQVVAATSGARASGFPRMVRSGDQVILAWTDAEGAAAVRVTRATLGRAP